MKWHMLAVVPVRVREHSELMGCEVQRVVGFRSICSCEWRGPVRRTRRAARDDRAEHLPVDDGPSRTTG